ncbi:MAG TPA: TSUP family transporter, partial [Nakamurella sp.]|nr:TSUP family transporter [Nakamurella sp.]
LLPESLQRVNALKNVLSLGVNLVAATAYTIVAFDQISWAAAGLIAAGTLCGGFIGAKVGRKLPAPVLRGIIVCLGIVAIWRLLAG